jgi:hypothetical protein
MKFNKNELFRLTVGKFFLFALLALVLVSQTVQASDADFDMNTLPMLETKVPLTDRNVTMPVSAISENKIHPTRPIEAVYAGFIRESVRNDKETKTAIDGLVADSKNRSFALGDAAKLVDQLNSLATNRKANMNAINSYYGTAIGLYLDDANRAIQAQLGNTYAAAITDRDSSVSTRITNTLNAFDTTKIAVKKGYTETAMVILKDTLDSTYNGLLSGAINVATLAGTTVAQKATSSRH